jgi:uncharacterized LabA/DUF88 family protein
MSAAGRKRASRSSPGSPVGRHPRPREVPIIDVALAVDFVMMVARRDCDVGILFSSDTDLVPPVAQICWPPGAALAAQTP